jgi:hypothetical protein
MTMCFRTVASAFAMACSFAALPSLAASSQISPLEPYEGDLVNLRMTVDSCAFAPESVLVTALNNVVRVAHRQNACLVAGEPRVVDIRLGVLPIGSWQVEVYPNGEPNGQYSERIFFSVRSRPQVAVFPPPPRPLTDYSGQWYKPAEAGWGLSIHQSSANVVFAAWYVHGATGAPTWYTLQQGQWLSSTTWSGSVYRTSGPPFFGAVFDPSLVSTTNEGTATLEFQQKPGEEGFATLSYVVNGQAGSKRITRLAF